jgi:hypothetical protein
MDKVKEENSVSLKFKDTGSLKEWALTLYLYMVLHKNFT